MTLLIPILLIQPTFIIWALYKTIKFLFKVSNTGENINFKEEIWFLILIITAVIIPLLGFSINASEPSQSAESWGDDNFRLFDISYIKDIIIFYFITLAVIGIISFVSKNHLFIAIINNGLLLSLILLSIFSTIQLGPVGLLMSGIPILGLLLIAPLFNVFLFLSVFIYNTKKSAAKQISFGTNLLLAIGVALIYIILFQVLLSSFGSKELSLIKAFTQTKDGFFFIQNQNIN